jgi:hypothetical protein
MSEGEFAEQSVDAPRESRLSPKGCAVASLVLGFFPLCGVGSVLALVLGYRARREIPEHWDGRGMATAGIVLGWIGVVTATVGWFLLISAVVTGAAT